MTFVSFSFLEMKYEGIKIEIQYLYIMDFVPIASTM